MTVPPLPPSLPPPPPEQSGPPDDPEEWSDDEWLAWLRLTDDEEGSDEAPSPRVSARWRDRPSATVLGAAMLGLRNAIYGRVDDEIVIVQEASGDPPDDDRPVVHLDPDYPERSEVRLRRRKGRPPRR